MTFKEIRQASGMNLTQFSEYFEIPYRTIQHWEAGTRQCPEYLMKLMQYKLDTEPFVQQIPVGYKLKAGKLVVDEEQADNIKDLFECASINGITDIETYEKVQKILKQKQGIVE